MPRGPAPTPLEQKRRRGTLRADRHNTSAAALAVIDVGTPEPRSGQDLIDTLLAGPAANWIGQTDHATLLLVRDAWDRRTELRTLIAVEGSSYEVRGRWYPRPERDELADLEKRITTWLAQLGLNPADRGRLGVAEVKAQSALERIRASRERKVTGS